MNTSMSTLTTCVHSILPYEISLMLGNLWYITYYIYTSIKQLKIVHEVGMAVQKVLITGIVGMIENVMGTPYFFLNQLCLQKEVESTYSIIFLTYLLSLFQYFLNCQWLIPTSCTSFNCFLYLFVISMLACHFIISILLRQQRIILEIYKGTHASRMQFKEVQAVKVMVMIYISDLRSCILFCFFFCSWMSKHKSSSYYDQFMLVKPI